MAMTVALGTTVSAAPVAVPATGAGTGATVGIDGAHPGPEFQGIGAISGGGATLIARFQGFRRSAINQFRGYELKVHGNGAWQLVANGPAGLGSLGYYPVRYPGFTVRPQAIEPGA